MKKHGRGQLFVDAEVQGAILKRILVYWSVCILFVTLPIWLFESVTHSDQMFYEHLGQLALRFWPMYAGLFALLPLLIWEAMRMTNRFCGPMRRVLAELDQQRETGNFRQLKFRDQDFWNTLAASLAELASNQDKSREQHADVSA